MKRRDDPAGGSRATPRIEAPPTRRILTHGYFELRLEEECHRVRRVGSSSAVMSVVFEPDAPREVAERVLASSLRVFDVIAQYAPSDYELLLGNLSPGDSDAVVRRLSAAFAAAGVPARIGVALCPKDGETSDELLEHARAATHLEAPSMDVAEAPEGPGDAMRDLQALVAQVAPSEISILILGETGVGKDRLARAIHAASLRASGPFVGLNCGALVESLLESELFGHERGAFTGATQDKPGLVESASGGTLFLDEIGELPMSIQVKLLRVLEERRARRVGGLRDYAVDVRILSATNRDLEVEMARGAFRQDLFFRLNGIVLSIPPLRERSSEIPDLARSLLGEACRRFNRTPEPEIAPEVWDLFRQYAWPGNIRELRNVIDRAVVLCASGTITLAHVPTEKMSARFSPRTMPPAPWRAPAEPRTNTTAPVPVSPTSRELVDEVRSAPPLGEELSAIERQRILEALEACGGNQTQAAVLLGVSRRTLVNRLSSLDIPRPRKRATLVPRPFGGS